MSETALFALAAALLGAVIGSFLNALSFRFNTGKGMLGRSRCMHCGHGLSAPDLVPVFSYLFLHGQCRYCSARLSPQYPLVEAAAAFLSFLVYLNHPGFLVFSFWLLVWMTILFVVVYDLRHGIIPWSCSLLLIVLALFAFVAGLVPSGPTALLAGPLLALPLFLISLVSLGRWMGWGDSVFELSIGWLLGATLGASALLLAFWSGAIVGVTLIFLSRLRRKKTMLQFTMGSEVPFAPFLAFGAFLAHFFHVDFFSALALF